MFQSLPGYSYLVYQMNGKLYMSDSKKEKKNAYIYEVRLNLKISLWRNGDIESSNYEYSVCSSTFVPLGDIIIISHMCFVHLF